MMYFAKETLILAQSTLWEGNTFATIVGAIIGALAAWLFVFLSARADVYRERAELILRMQRQLQRQFRDMIVLRRAYDHLRYLANGINRMKATLHVFCEEKIPLGGSDFLLDYIDKVTDFELITDSDSEYQALVIAYREWHQSYHKISQIGNIEEFDFSTGRTVKKYMANDFVVLKMHADYSYALLQTLDRAVDLNIKAADVLLKAAHVHRNKSRFSETPRVKVLSNSVKYLSDIVSNEYKATRFVLSADMEMPFAILIGPAVAICLAENRYSHVNVEVDLPNSQDIGAIAVRISHEIASLISSSSNAVCFYWVNGENVVLFDSWLYRKPELLGTVSSMVLRRR